MTHTKFPACRPRAARFLAAATLTSALALAGCASTGTTSGPTSGMEADKSSPASDANSAAAAGKQMQDMSAKSDDALRDAAFSATRTQDYVAAAAYWGNLYDRKPDNVEAAVSYSKALRQIGSVEQSLSVMQRIHTLKPDDADVLAEFGKALAAGGHPDQAQANLARAESLKPDDWTILSAEGVALDQMGQYANAQAKYAAALKIAPGNPSILTNLGLSYALQGKLDEAEKTLRQAAADPHATVGTRQNLAVVLGLEGKFDEASRLAHADLPPTVADNNIAYLKEMLTQPSPWKQLQSLDGKTSDDQQTLTP